MERGEGGRRRITISEAKEDEGDEDVRDPVHRRETEGKGEDVKRETAIIRAKIQR